MLQLFDKAIPRLLKGSEKINMFSDNLRIQLTHNYSLKKIPIVYNLDSTYINREKIKKIYNTANYSTCLNCLV
jgi:hypothetical protein